MDAYMQMKKDRHIRFYTKAEWLTIGETAGFAFADGFETSISFPKKKETASELAGILERFDEQVVEGYNLKLIGNEIWITERVNNLLFRKGKKNGESIQGN